MKTEEITNLLVSLSIDEINTKNTEWQFVAARLIL